MPSRIIHHTEGVAWLTQSELTREHAVITSLPDSSEVPRLDFAAWREWFIDAAATACRATHEAAVTIFFQTDVKREGVWIDKGFLVQLGAERAGSALLWHKIVCRAPAGKTSFGRPAYAHLLCFSRQRRLAPAESTPDVLPGLGAMTWPRAMGIAPCKTSCCFVLESTPCRTVVDPFCGVGTVLAVANALGMDAIGVELSRKRAERARALELVLP